MTLYWPCERRYEARVLSRIEEILIEVKFDIKRLDIDCLMMRLTSIPPPVPASSETLSSLCDWWMTTKEEALPGICHWFIHPQNNQPRFSLSFQQNQSAGNSSFSPIGYSGNVNMLDMDHPIHSTASISLILILGSVLFILLVTAFITCITRKKRVQVCQLSQSNSSDI